MPEFLPTRWFLLVALLPLAAVARDPTRPWNTPLMDSIHAAVETDDLRTADSLVRSHAQELLDSNSLGRYSHAVLLFLTGKLDSILALATDDRLAVHPIRSRDTDLGLILGHAAEEIGREIDSSYGKMEAAAALKLFRQAMTEFAVMARKDSIHDPEWFYEWKPSPTRRKLNDQVLEHLSAYGDTPYGRTLSDKVYFSLEKYKAPIAMNILEGSGWLDGRDAGPIWWRSTSFLFEYRSDTWYAYMKYGRAVGGTGLAFNLLETPRFVLSPYAGVSQYPFVTLGEYANTRQYIGPDLGFSVDWKFKIWKPPRALLNLYLRTQSGVVIDPNRLPMDFHRTSFVFLNLGIGANLDIFAQYTPYVRNGRIKFHRELNWR
jgi:hypothetical protein